MRWLIVVSLLGACHRSPSLAIVGDTAKLRRDEALPATSPLFDGHVVKLRGARGETLGVQVLTHKQERAALVVEGARVDAFAIHYVDVREPSTAMYGPSRGRGAYPDALEPAAAPVAGDALFDVAVARDATPGLHRGTLTVGTRTIAVELTVEPLVLALPPFVWIWYQPGEIARAHHLPDDDAQLLPIERQYEALVRAHGAYLASDLPPARFEARRDFLDGTRYWPVHVDEDRLRADADFWERRFAALPQVPFATTVDEPRDAAERAEARRMARGDGQARQAPARRHGGAVARLRRRHRRLHLARLAGAASLDLQRRATVGRQPGHRHRRHGAAQLGLDRRPLRRRALVRLGRHVLRGSL